MRMEELSESRYIKGTDSVERYLLDLVRSYFKDNNVADVTSREFIIRKAVARMKEEFQYENIGVLSITLADGVPRTGPVTITLTDLGAEPVINPKRSAFNVNFGNEANTACEGNDPRLSDSRDPNPHTHDIQDINGLEGRLSTLLSLVNRVSGYAHTHQNSSVLDKLIYSGNAATIDLNCLDTLEADITSMLDDVRDRISTLINTDIPNRIGVVEQKLNDTETKIQQAQLTTGATHQNYLNQAKTYADNQIPAVLNQFENCFDGYVTETQLTSVVTGSLSYIDSMLLSGSLMRNKTPNDASGYFMHEANISDDILQEIVNRGTNLHDCLIDILIRRDNGAGGYEWTKAPYLYTSSNGSILGTIIIDIDYENKKIRMIYKCANIAVTGSPGQYRSARLPTEIKNAVVEVKFYAKRSVTTT